MKQWKVLLHPVICASFLILPYAFDPGGLTFPLFDFDAPLQRSVFLSYVFMLGLFYLNYYFLIPRLYFQRKVLLYILTVVVLCFMVVNTAVVVLRLSGQRPEAPPGENGRVRGNHFPMDRPPGELPGSPLGARHGMPPYTNGIFICTIGVFVTLSLRVHDKWKENEEKKLSAEISSLKLQVNPHFLFNTLNSLYAFALKERSMSTASSILKLSGIMRYVVTEASQDFVSLEKEINYINDYIDLQKMRLDTCVELIYEVTGDVTGLQIAPLTLIPFIENAFKYGVNPDEDSRIAIAIRIEGKELVLKVENNKVTIADDPMMKSGKGIQNTKARLDHLYGGRYLLSIDDSPRRFNIKVTIQL
jgi:hypothetical protein